MSFKSVVLDVDSTLCGLEGIDWLGQLRGADIARTIASQTNRAMRGEIPLESVYGERLDIIRPTSSEIDSLAAAYIESLAPGATEVIGMWLGSGIRVVLVSSGIRQAILPLAEHLGLAAEDVNAVSLKFDASGSYTGFDSSSPLTVATGKQSVVTSLGLPQPSLAAGDGITDLAMRGAVAAFAAFTGFVNRPEIVAQADLVAASFSDLASIVSAGYEEQMS